ncbi:MAG: inositol monophosphatase family protein [Actinomycetes bacterium]
MQTEAVSALIQDVCARVILPRFRALEHHEVEQKRPGDLVTVADREAEVELTQALLAATPGALVVGEEASFGDPLAGDDLAGAEHAWVIDPVDGTRNFAAGKVDFGVMVAEVRSGETVRGWIWQPLHDVLYVAERGAGATRNGAVMPRLLAGDEPWRVAVWPRLRHARAEGLTLRPTRGSCAIDYPSLATGHLEGLAYRSLNPWDHLPGALLVAEVGGAALVAGRPYAPGVRGRMLAVGASDAVASAIDARLRDR